MTKSPKFVTIFPQAQDVHLRKSLGMVPYVLHRDFGYDAALVCFNNQDQFPSLVTQTPGLKLEFLSTFLRFSPFLAVVVYLLAHARKIDFLMLYGQSRSTFFIGMTYKLLHKQGRLLFKADMNVEYLSRLRTSNHFRRHYRFWNFYFNVICYLVCAEYPSLKNTLLDVYRLPNHKIFLLPNGIDLRTVKNMSLSRKKFDEKEYIILVVGRIGATEKNHELILKAATQLDFKDWQIHFVGPLNPEFSKKADVLFEQFPKLRQSIIFISEINNYQALCSVYNQAKIFCLSSSREGFPVVIPEAMYWGNLIVSTPVSAMPDILENGKLGLLFDTADELAIWLQSIIDNPEQFSEMVIKSIKKAEEQYVWEKIVHHLAVFLSK